MSEALVESTAYAPTVSVPAAGEARTSAVLKPAFQALADRTRSLFTYFLPMANAQTLGCQADGKTDDTKRAQATLDAAYALTKRAYFPPGRYRLTAGLVVAGAMTIELAPGAVLDFSGASPGTICLSASGTEAATVALTGDALEGSKTVVLSTVVGLAPGNLLRVSSEAVFDPETRSEFGELARIDTIVGSTVTLQTPLQNNYLASDNAVASKVTPISGITLRGGTILGGGTLTANDTPIEVVEEASKGQAFLKLASVDGLVAGDKLLVRTTFEGIVGQGDLSEMATVKSVDGALVTLADPLRYPHARGTVLPNSAELGLSPEELLDLTPAEIIAQILAPAGTAATTVSKVGQDADHTGLRVLLGQDIAVHGTRFERCDLVGVWLRDTIESKVEGCYFTHAMNDNQAYGISFDNACQDCLAYGNTFVDVRHSMTTANSTATRGITRRIIFANNTVSDSAPARGGSGGDAIDTHAAAEDIFITGNSVFKSSGGGINVECRRAKVEGNFVQSTADYGIIYHNESYFEGEVSICKNVVRDTGWDGIRVNMPTRGNNSAQNRSVVVANNQVSGAALIGILFTNSRKNGVRMTSAVVSGNVVKGAGSPSGSIYVEDVEGAAITGNVVSEPGDPSQPMLRVRDCRDCVVLGNTLRHVASATGVGVYVNSSGAGTCAGILVSGNIVAGPTPAGLRGVVLDGSGDIYAANCVVRTNQLKACSVAVVAGEGPGHEIPDLTSQTLHLASGRVTVRGSTRELVLDTETELPTGQLLAIDGGEIGQMLVVRSYTSARQITIKDTAVAGDGALLLGGDFTLATGNDALWLIKCSNLQWRELSRGTN